MVAEHLEGSLGIKDIQGDVLKDLEDLVCQAS